MIRVGLIGGGGIADEHLRGYARARRPDRRHRGRRPGEPASAARSSSAPPRYDDFRTLIAEADVDAVDICLPHHLHRDAIVAAAAAGQHILCEKPLCLTAAEAAEVRDAVAASGITLMCAHNQLFLPAVAEAKAVLEAGTLGRVYEVRTTDSFFNGFDPANMGWRASAATSGGGELIDTGYHPTYLLLHLAGGAPAEVTAMLSTHRLAFMEGEDSAQVLVRFDNGVVGADGHQLGLRPGARHRALLGGRRARRAAQRRDRADRRRCAAGRRRRATFDPVDQFAAEIGHFADCLAHGRRPLHTEHEGIEALGIILAAYEAARTRCVAPVIRA